MRPLLPLLLAVLAAAACHPIPAANYPLVAPAEDGVPALGSGDSFDITIFNGSKETKSSFTLGDSGMISVQYIGDVDAHGKTADQLATEIKARLADGFLRDPIVSVTVTEVNSRKVSISGEVQKNGTIKYIPGMTIVDAIALSGGFTPMAKKNEVQVIRIVDGKEVSYTIPVEAIQGNKRPNFPMASGDRVFVPERIF